MVSPPPAGWARKLASAAPLAASTAASLCRAAPPMLVKSPATMTLVPSLASARTWPFGFGEKPVTRSPVVALIAARYGLVTVMPPRVVTVVKLPPM
jgi:hypothetical protein